MPPMDRHLFDKLLEVTEENNRILKSLRSSARWSTFWTVIKLIVFIGPVVVAYFYLAPYWGVIKQSTLDMFSALETLQSLSGQGTSTPPMNIDWSQIDLKKILEKL